MPSTKRPGAASASAAALIANTRRARASAPGSRRSRAAASSPTARPARAGRSRRGPAPRWSRRRCSRAASSSRTKRSCSSSGTVWSGIVMPSRANAVLLGARSWHSRGRRACAREPLPCARNGSRPHAHPHATRTPHEAAQAGAGDRAARDQRARAERAPHAAPDLDAGPRAREHVRADRRARRRGGGSRACRRRATGRRSRTGCSRPGSSRSTSTP